MESRSAIQQWASDLRLVTDTLVDIDPDLRELVVNAPDAGAAIQQLVDDAGPGPGLAGPQPRHPQQGHDPAAGRRRADAGHLPRRRLRRLHRRPRTTAASMRSHFGFVLNAGDPHACVSRLHLHRADAAVPAPWPPPNADASRCDVINGRDPNPGDSTTSAAPTSAVSRTSAAPGEWLDRAAEQRGRQHRRSPAVLDDVLGGSCTPTPSPARWGDRGMPPAPDNETTRRIRW